MTPGLALVLRAPHSRGTARKAVRFPVVEGACEADRPSNAQRPVRRRVRQAGQGSVELDAGEAVARPPSRRRAGAVQGTTGFRGDRGSVGVVRSIHGLDHGAAQVGARAAPLPDGRVGRGGIVLGVPALLVAAVLPTGRVIGSGLFVSAAKRQQPSPAQCRQQGDACPQQGQCHTAHDGDDIDGFGWFQS